MIMSILSCLIWEGRRDVDISSTPSTQFQHPSLQLPRPIDTIPMNMIFYTATCNRLTDGASHFHFDGESTEQAWVALNPHGGIGMHALT
jgi:hypothetical protein